MLHKHLFSYSEQIIYIIQLQLCQHEEHSDWELFLWNSVADKHIRNLKKVSAEEPFELPLWDVEAMVKGRADTLGVQTSKSRESAERTKIHTTYLFYKYWQEYQKEETQLTDGYRARDDKQWGKYIIHWTVMKIFQSVLRDHESLKGVLPRNFTGWLLYLRLN